MGDRWLQHVNVKFPAAAASARRGGPGAGDPGVPPLDPGAGPARAAGRRRRLPPRAGGSGRGAGRARGDLRPGPRRRPAGLLYNRRTRLDAAPAEALPQAFRAALEACRKLEQEPEFGGTLSFEGGVCEVVSTTVPWRPTTPPPAPACAPSWNRCWTACGAPAVTASSPSASPATAWPERAQQRRAHYRRPARTPLTHSQRSK